MKISIMAKEGNKTGVLISYIELCKYFQDRKFHIYSTTTKNKKTEIVLIDEYTYIFLYITFIEE